LLILARCFGFVEEREREGTRGTRRTRGLERREGNHRSKLLFLFLFLFRSCGRLKEKTLW